MRHTEKKKLSETRKGKPIHPETETEIEQERQESTERKRDRQPQREI